MEDSRRICHDPAELGFGPPGRLAGPVRRALRQDSGERRAPSNQPFVSEPSKRLKASGSTGFTR